MNLLNGECVPPPRAIYYSGNGRDNPTRNNGLWSANAVKNILNNECYLGNIVQGKHGTVSYKNRSMIPKLEEHWIRAEGMHEPLVCREDWDIVRSLDKRNYKPREDSEGVVHLFASLLKCADCGYNLRAHITYDKLKDGTKKRRTAYLCGNYARSGKSACTVHLLQEPVLTQLVLDEIREHAALTAFDEQRVIKAVGSEKNRESISLNELHRQQLRQYEDRLSELDKITRMLYEDRVNGIISEMMFKEMTANYERERTERDNAVKELRVKIEQCERTVCDVNAWIKTIRKYTELTELTREVLIELIDSIEVFEPEKVGKRRVCRIRIKYRFVGVVGEMLTTTDDDTPADAERGGVLEQAV